MRKLAWYLFFAALAFVALALLWASSASAQTACPTGTVANDAARVCWTNATSNTDGSAIPTTGPAALKETRIFRSVCNADGTFGAVIETISVPPTIGVALFSGLPPARNCFRARHVNNAGVLSAASAVVTKTTTAPAPPQPRQPNLTIA